jgi:adhesin/invasin
MISYGGGQQTGAAGTVLPTPITVQVQDAYKNGVPGISVTFDNGGKGAFLSQATITTGSTGKAGVSYQLPNLPGKYTVKVSSAGLKTLSFTEFAVVGPAANVAVVSGNNQSAPAGGALPQPLIVRVTDQAGNAVSGTSVVFTAPIGTFTGSPATTDSSGNASVAYTAGTVAGPVSITATAGSASVQFTATVTAGPAAALTITGGNNQAAPAGTPLGQLLSVAVADQYGNPVQNNGVFFVDGGAGGQFSNANPVMTDNTGTAAQGYTLPGAAGTVFVTAAATGVATPASFTETSQ